MLQWACTPFLDEEDVLNGACGCEMESTDPVGDWIDMASDILYQLSGGEVFGVCTRTVRPVTCDSVCYPVDRYRNGMWGPDYSTLLGGLAPVRLRVGSTVVGIKIDGVTLNPSNYAIVDGQYLIRTDSLRWPTYNNLAKRDTEVGTWALTVSFGTAPDLLTRQAAQELVCELGKADGALRNYRFPAGVVAANVQGASAAIQDEIDGNGDSTLPNVARFLSIYAPEGRVQSSVWSPEIDSAYRLIEVAYS